MRITITVFIVMSLAVSHVAYADSDGYYCVGPDYLAYQFGMDTPDNPVRLFVIRIGTVEPVAIQLVPFQVHGMQCNGRVVELLGWTNVYTVRLDESKRPVQYGSTSLSTPGEHPVRFVPPTANLARLSPAVGSRKPEQVKIGTDARGYAYTLEMAPRSVGRCSVEMTSRVVESDTQGRQTRIRIVFRAEVTRDCGE